NGFPPLIETRVFSNGTKAFRVRSIKVEPGRTALITEKKQVPGKLVMRTKTLLSRPLERAIARSIGPLVDKLEANMERQVGQLISRLDRIENQQNQEREIVEKFRALNTLKGLGIEDHLLGSYGSVPPLHPIGGWHIGTGIDNPTNLHKDRVSKWNALAQPALLVWHAELKVMLWPGNESSRALFITGNFEPSEMSWLADTLEDDMVFIDVGANMGLYTMFAAKLVGAGGRVVAVEPSE